MARSVGNNKTSPLFGWLARWKGMAGGPARPVLCAAMMIVLFFGGWYSVWRHVRSRVLSSPQYLVTADSVQITPPPEWIRADIRADALRNASLEGRISALDDDVLPRIAAAFSLHPWVEKVRRLSKRAPARIVAELEYRRPVLMVDTPAGLLPVDARGILLPAEDFSPVERAGYPRLVGVSSVPLAVPGEPWGDAQVVGAAEIAVALDAVWQDLRLSHIMPWPNSGGPSPSQEPIYVLVDAEGATIVWGYAPGANVPREPSSAEKVARLRQLLTASRRAELPRTLLDLRAP